MRHLDTTTAVGAAVPDLAAESRAVQSCGEFVGGERAGSALDVAAVEGRLAGHGAAGERGRVGGLGWDYGCEGGAGCRREEGEGGWEVHGWEL